LSAQPTGTAEGATARLIVDASTLVRWSGPPVGIVRAEAEIIRWVLDHDPAAVISVYDTRSSLFRPLDPVVARALIAGTAVVETSLLPDARPIERTPLDSFWRRIGTMLQPALRIQRTLACAVDERRRAISEGPLRRGLDRVTGALLDARLQSRALAKDGKRRDLYRLDSVLGTPLQLSGRDTLLLAGLDWNTKDAAVLTAMKARSRFRLVMMCYDLIPVVFPQFYAARDVDVFTRFFRTAIESADRFIAISKRTAADLAEFARAHGRAGLDIRTERLGADAARRAGDTSASLPTGLVAGRYVLFVSTVEPRKNHAMLLRVWKRLAAGEHGGANGFKLVFAGRRGWMTDDVFAAIEQDVALNRDVIHIAGASDEELEALYGNAAFCVYPSLYEGFGLPVIEAFSHSKPVIVSSAGALPEAAGFLAPCLDPKDETAWVEAMGRCLNDPSLVAEQARRIRAEFSWPTWSETAARIVAVARER
jgi:glycosyltransferase involved in cell wall biosynthesis